MANENEKTIDIIVNAEDRTGKGLIDADRSLKAFNDRTRKMREDEEKKTESFFKSLKSRFGEDSAFGLAAKTAIGAGAVAGVGVITNALESATHKAVDLRNQFSQGKIDALGFADGLARSIPIIGDIYGSFSNVVELLDGGKLRARQFAEEAAALDRLAASREASFKATEQAIANTHRMLIDLREKGILADLGDSLAGKLTAAQIAARTAAGGITATQQADIDKIKAANIGTTIDGKQMDPRTAATITAAQLARLARDLDAARTAAGTRADRNKLQNDIGSDAFEVGSTRGSELQSKLADMEAAAARAADIERQIANRQKVLTDARERAERQDKSIAAVLSDAAKSRLASTSNFVDATGRIIKDFADKFWQGMTDAADKAIKESADQAAKFQKTQEGRLKREREIAGERTARSRSHFDAEAADQRDRDTEGSRIDSALNSFFDFEKTLETLNPQLIRDRTRSPFHATATADVELGLTGVSAAARERGFLSSNSDPALEAAQEQAREAKAQTKLLADIQKTNRLLLQALQPTSALAAVH
jgi:hypothetical protein